MADILTRRENLDTNKYRGKVIQRPMENMATSKTRREAWSRFFHHSLQKKPILSTSGSVTSRLQNWDTINFCCSNYSVRETLLETVLEN